MAKARVSLRGVNKAVNQLAKDLEKLQRQPADRAAKSEMGALHRKLTRIQTLLDGECPEGLFRSFDVAEPVTMRRARARRKTAKKR